MVNFLNRLLNGDFYEMSADEKAAEFGRILENVFNYLAKLLDLPVDAE